MSEWYKKIVFSDLHKIAGFGTGHWQTKSFRDCLAKLPADIQDLAYRSYEKMLLNHQQVGVKPLPGTKSSIPIYSAHVGPKYRVLGLKTKSYYIWYWIGSHNGYNRAKDMPPHEQAMSIAQNIINRET